MSTLPLGKYRHYKGHEYQVIGIATHSESLEELVVYVPLYGEGGYWVRPLRMFVESVVVDGEQVPRFQYLGACSGQNSEQNPEQTET